VTIEDVWNAYARTIVEICPPSQPVLQVSPAPNGQVGVWPSGLGDEIFVITAWNPRSEVLDADTNRSRQVALEADLIGLEFWPAAGLDPNSDYREEGVAVSGLAEVDAIALGARYEQNAIFAWTPDAWRILSCDGTTRVELGWFVEQLNSPSI
jgi:Protein of unknown function (DUF3293)